MKVLNLSSVCVYQEIILSIVTYHNEDKRMISKLRMHVPFSDTLEFCSVLLKFDSESSDSRPNIFKILITNVMLCIK